MGEKHCLLLARKQRKMLWNIIAEAFAVGNISEHFVKDSESEVFKIFRVEGCQVV